MLLPKKLLQIQQLLKKQFLKKLHPQKIQQLLNKDDYIAGSLRQSRSLPGLLLKGGRS